MISECVVFASCLMLTAAQLQLPFQQIISLPNLQPMQLTTLPNSEALMTQSAHSILNQDATAPLNPGIYGGVPVLVSEAAQSILDQESRIVGYNLPANLQAVFQQQQAIQQHQNSPSLQSQYVIPSSPQIIPITQNDAVRANGYNIASEKARSQPQSLSIPVLNTESQQRPGNNVVPVRAVVSFKSLLTSQKPSDSVLNQYNSHYQPINTHSVYYDIPPNHPVPAPTSSSSLYPSETPSSDVAIDSYRQQPVHTTTNGAQSPNRDVPVEYNTNHDDEAIVFMRPPPPSKFESFYRPESDENQETQGQGTREQVQRYRENDRPVRPIPESPTSPPTTKLREDKQIEKTQRRKKPKNRPSKSGSTTTEKSQSKQKYSSVQDSIESSSTNIDNQHHSDSSSEPSENSFLSALLQVHQRNNPHSLSVPPPPNPHSSYERPNPPSYERYNDNYNSQGVVHKHIFVHAAPEISPQGPRVRVIRPPVNQEKHLQIIFVKSPTEAPATQTVVELPPAEQPKTVVYVLSKQQEAAGGNVKVISPPTSKPHAPEIYFIRYGDRRQNQGYPVPDLQSVNAEDNSSNYGSGANSNSQQLAVAAPVSINPELLTFLRQKRNKDYGLDVYAPLMAYSRSGQINEITQEEADSRKSSLDAFF